MISTAGEKIITKGIPQLGNGMKGKGLGGDVLNFLKKAVKKGSKVVSTVSGGVAGILNKAGLTPADAMAFLAKIADETEYKKYSKYLKAAAAGLKVIEQEQKKGKGLPDILSSPNATIRGMGQKGGSFWSDFADGFVAGVTLGAVTPGKSKDVASVLPFGKKGFLEDKIGVSGSTVVGALAPVLGPEATVAATALKLAGSGKKGNGAQGQAGEDNNDGSRDVVPVKPPNSNLTKGDKRGSMSGWAAIQQSPNSNSFAVVSF